MSVFKVVGVSTLNGVTKVRFANDFVSRVKILNKQGHTDIDLIITNHYHNIIVLLKFQHQIWMT